MADCDVESAIERLEAVLNENNLRAERIMPLRSPKTDELDKISGVINQTFEKLLEAMALASLGSEAIVALTNSKQEFDARKSEWLSKLALTHEPPHSSELPPLQLAKSISKSSATSVSLSSKRSSASSKISFKLLQAKAKLRIAQLEAQHEEERAKEQLLKRRETQRKIALAETELQVYEEAMEDSVSCSCSTKQTITHTAVTLSGATVNTSTISNKENEFATLSKESNLTTSSSPSYFRPEDKPALSLFQQSTDVSLGHVLPSQSFPTAFKLGCDSFPSLSSSTSVPSSCSVLPTTNVCTQIASSSSSCSDSAVTKLVGSAQNEFPTNQIPFPEFPAPQGPMFSGLVLEPGIGRGGSSLNGQGEAGGEVSVASDTTNPEHNNLFAEGGAWGALLPKVNATAGEIRVDAMMNQRSVSSRKVQAPNPVSGFPPRVSCSVPSKSSGLVQDPNFTFQGQSVTTVPPGFPPKEPRFLQSVISGMANKAPSCSPLTQSIPTIKEFSSGGLVQGVHVGVQGLTSGGPLVTGNDACQPSSQNPLLSYNQA